ncbi:restriction endonuclease subunit S [Colwellia sp. C1TZA3]|uniref:restriction endonuclease subunit S n=1 Tax=Colwellia sp. C1TZA3 TaxID=2508879 RepID=UPI0011B9D0C9|nr:restriction endonuclease subunit S [Colwellia sp. C1TZA3]TWX71406.1 restriction endonuclease subunit S [Colwellia sp. C1TZA3]
MNNTALSGKYAAYPEYRNSEVDWIEKLPAHWQESKLRYKFSFGKGLTITKANLTDKGVPCVNYGEVHSKYGFEIDPAIDPLKCVSDNYIKSSSNSLLFKGDLVFADTSEDIEGSGNFTQLTSDETVFAGYHTIIARPNDRKCYRFYAYLLDSLEIRTQIRHAVKGVKVFSVTQAILRGINIWLPALEERKTIASFLDHETAKIDTLIEKQQQLIKLLKEKRQAVISHAVTKGISNKEQPNVPMRDSGVEWLGEVPEHWIVRRLKHTSKLQSGIPKGKDLTGKVSISVPMLRVANVQDGYLNLNDVHKMDIIPEQLERFSLQKGDVLMNEGGDNDKLGRGAVWQNEIEPCIHQNHVFAIRPYSIEPEWLDLVTRTSYAKFHFYRVAKQSTNLASISSTNIKETPLVIPPAKERDEIIKYVNRKVDAFDKAEEKGAAQIALLQERRTALISAAVTGKIDVRNWVMPTPSSTNGATNDR